MHGRPYLAGAGGNDAKVWDLKSESMIEEWSTKDPLVDVTFEETGINSSPSRASPQHG